MPSETNPRTVELELGAVEAGILGMFASDIAPRSMWFDGGRTSTGWFGAWPDLVLEGEHPELLDDAEVRWRRDPERVWMGWLSYEWGVDRLLGRSPARRRIPGIGLRRFPAALELQAGARAIRVHGDPQDGHRLLAALGHMEPAAPSPWPWGPLRARQDEGDYHARVEAVREHIAAGDTYQVNLAQRFDADWRVEPSPAIVAAAYGQLRTHSDAPMGALFACEDTWVLSNSPETLLSVTPRDGDVVARSWPIKGTVARLPDPEADGRAQLQLRRSIKDAAEHVMIVDLVRNDLGTVSRPGTVRASGTPRIMSLATVHHLVTEVSALADPTVSLREWVAALFPGGSITGAPKRRTVEIIEALECQDRGFYCGSLLLLAPCGLRMSIAIRTATADPRGLQIHGGGGIVIDSQPESERLETLAKVRAFAGPFH